MALWVERDRLKLWLRSVTGVGAARLSLRAGGGFHIWRVSGWDQGTVTARGGDAGQAAAGRQTLTRAVAVRVVMPRPAPGKAWRALVLRSRCRWRSMTMRCLPSARRVSWWKAFAMGAGRLAVAAPDRMLARAARRAAVKETWRGWTLCPARRPLRAAAAWRAAARARLRMSSVPQIQAACSAVISSGACERMIGPVDGPAPVMADFASFSEVSDPVH